MSKDSSVSQLISFWESVLHEDQWLMGISIRSLVVQTIGKLKDLEKLKTKEINDIKEIKEEQL